MHGPLHKLAVLAVGLWLTAAVGCAQTSQGNWSWPWTKKPTNDYLSQVKTPDDRMKELKELAKKAPKQPAAEQQASVAALCKEFQNESQPLMRRHILRTLTEYPQPEAAAAIVAALSDGDMETRRTACVCMGKRGGPDAVRELSRVISSDTVHDVRIAAVRALGQTKDKAAMAPLAEALADTDPAMQTRAEESLANISGHDFGNNVKAWREYASTGKSEAPEVSLAERIKRSFY